MDGAVNIDLYPALPVNPPTVSGMFPTTVAGSNISSTNGVVLTISGNGFLPGASCNFNNSGISVASCTVVNTTEIDATINIQENVAGKQSVTITNTDGGLYTATDAFTILAEPYLSYVVPASVQPSSDGPVTVSIFGGNFDEGATCIIGGLPTTPCTFVSSGELQTGVSVPIGTATGAYSGTVNNLDGTSATFPGLLWVGTPPVNIHSISPSAANPGDSIMVSIKGQYFEDPTVNFGTGIGTCAIHNWDSSTINCNITVAADAPLGPQDVTVTNSDGNGSATAPNAFTVFAPVVPVIDSASPNSFCATQFQTVVDLAGSGFEPGATCVVSAQYNILFQELGGTVYPCVVASDALITVKIQSSDEYRGPFTLLVTNPDGSSVTTPTLIFKDC